MSTATIRVTGDISGALKALDALGIKSEETGEKSESVLTKASERIAAGFKAMGDMAAKAGFEAGEAMSVMGEKMEATEAKSKGLSSSFGGFSTIATLGLAAGVAAFTKMGISAAEAGEKIDAQLKTAVTDVGGKFDELEPKINAVDAASRQFGFTNEQTNEALATMTRGLGDPEKAMNALSVAEDLARAKGTDLNTAALAITKGMEGQTKPLKQLGIDLPTYAGGAQQVILAQQTLARSQETLNALLKKTPDAVKATSKAHNTYEKALQSVQFAQEKLTSTQNAGQTVLTAIKSRTVDAAKAYGDTLAGKMAAAKAQVDNLSENFGKMLLPAITAVIGAVDSAIVWFEKHKQVAEALAITIGSILAVAVGVKAVNALASFGNAAKDAIGVIGKIGSAVASGVGSLVEFVTGHEAATASVVADDEAMALASEEAGTASTLAFGPIGIAIAALAITATLLASHWKQVWSGIKTALTDTWNVIKPVFDAIGQVIGSVVIAYIDILKAEWSLVWGVVKTTLMDTWSVISTVFNAVKDLLKIAILIEIDILKTEWTLTWDAVKLVTQGAWAVLKAIFAGFKEVFQIEIVDPINIMRSAWDTVWNGIQSTVQSVWNVIQPILKTMSDTIGKVTGAVGGLVKGVGSVAGGIGGAIGGLFKAEGGPVTGSDFYIVGENGPEVFIPSQSGTIIPNSALGGDVSHTSLALPFGNQTPTDPHTESMKRQNFITDTTQAMLAAIRQSGLTDGPNGLRAA